MNQIDFIKESRNKFNDTYSYDNLNYTKLYEQIQLTCIKHSNTFTIGGRFHLKTNFGGCKYCEIDIKFNILQKESNNIFNSNFILENNNFKDKSSIIKIKCIKHNFEFQATLDNHLKNKTGYCEKCSTKNADNTKQRLIEKSNEKFNSESRDKEELPRIIFDFSSFEYKQFNEKGKILCVKHNNLFEIKPNLHLRYKFGGCNICKPKNYYTKEENRN